MAIKIDQFPGFFCANDCRFAAQYFSGWDNFEETKGQSLEIIIFGATCSAFQCRSILSILALFIGRATTIHCMLFTRLFVP